MNLLNWIILITLIVLLIIALFFWNRERNQRIELGYICDEYALLEVENQKTLAKYKDRLDVLEEKIGKKVPKETKTLNQTRREALEKIIEPIQEWLNEYTTPHDKLIISQGSVELTSGEFGIPLKVRD